MRVLILGGAGAIGSEVAENLASYPEVEEIVLGDIALDKAEKIAGKIRKAKAARIDATDLAALVSSMQKADVVVSSVGPFYKFGIPIIKAAVEAGVNFVDIMDDPDTTKAALDDKTLFDEAKSKGITIVVGLGFTPGLTNVLARYGASKLDEVASIDVSWVFTTAAGVASEAVTAHMFHVTSGKALTYENGEWREVTPLVDGQEAQDFVDLGEVEVYHVGHPEPVTIPRYIRARKVTCKAGMVPSEVVNIYRMLSRLRLTGVASIGVRGTKISPRDFIIAHLGSLSMDVARELFKFDAAEPLFEMRIMIRGKKNGHSVSYCYKFSDVGHEFATAISAVIGAVMLGRGQVKEKGVYAPEGCVDPKIFLREIAQKGVVIHEISQTSRTLQVSLD